MIEISGTIARDFLFPADVVTALAYYGELGRILPLLPHVSVLHTYAGHQFRVRYQTVELGAYTINIISDLQSEVDRQARVIAVRPGAFDVPVAAKAQLTSSTAYGLFSMMARFYELGEAETKIEYKLALQAQMPRPRGLRLMPKRALSRIGQGITNGRLREMADGFISQSLAAFPDWRVGQA